MCNKLLSTTTCPFCTSNHISPLSHYSVSSDAKPRVIFHCNDCKERFSETKGTPLEGLRTPLGTIALVIKALNNGMGINATVETFHIGKKSIYRWLNRLAYLKDVLLLYALSFQFLEQIIEGDELYTKVNKNLPQADSEGWTIMLLDRASRFIWELRCGNKDVELFTKAMQTLADLIKQTADVTLVTDGERRYGNILFDICRTVLRNGTVGRPMVVLAEGVKIRIKNKGSQAHKRGPKRKKYQSPKKEHPKTPQNIEEKEIHANHCEAQNSALRRRLSCYRRKTNTYSKKRSVCKHD